MLRHFEWRDDYFQLHYLSIISTAYALIRTAISIFPNQSPVSVSVKNAAMQCKAVQCKSKADCCPIIKGASILLLKCYPVKICFLQNMKSAKFKIQTEVQFKCALVYIQLPCNAFLPGKKLATMASQISVVV